MVVSRRNLLQASAALMAGPAFADTRVVEVEAKIARHDLKDLHKEDLPTPCMLVDQEIFDANLQKMATHCRLGRTQFARIFHEQTGDTPMRFINRMRVRLACRLLRGTRLPVTRIALDCGFGSSQYFAKVFNAYTGGMDACGYRRNRCPA